MARIDPKSGNPKPAARGCGGIFFLFVVIAGGIWGASLGAFVRVLDDTQATVALVDEYKPKIGTKILTVDGEVLGEFSTEARQLLRLSEIPINLQKAFIATEDHRFYEHRGVVIEAILSALKDGVVSGRLRGGSTITQQTVRNVDTTGITTEVTPQRKIKEAIFALQLERKYTKDEILELYLNQIFLGRSAHGVEAAARQYFDKSCTELTLGECALIAGLARAPNVQEPIGHPENARTRRDIVLQQMLDYDFITREEYETAILESVEDAVITPEKRAESMAQGKGFLAPNRFKAPYLVEEVRQFLLNDLQLGTSTVFEDGLQVTTTIDWRMQRAAEVVLEAHLGDFDRKKLESLTKQGKEDEFVPVSGALVCIDNRPGYQGYIRAMVGGRDFGREKYNTATQARRQAGSSIKPFVWTAALDSRSFTASSIEVDEPFTRVDGAGNTWSPKNFGADFAGPVTLRTALQKSINIVSVKLVEQLGMPLVRSYIERMHPPSVRIPINDTHRLTLGLGTCEVTVLGQCVAYSVFANGGVRYDPIFVSEIKDRDGFTIRKATVNKEQVLNPASAYVITHLLEGVATYGTGAKSAPLARPRAGKTGTTNEARDTWFCGFTPDFTCVVWVGYKDNRSLGRGTDFTGGRLSCPIWTDFMIEAEKDLPIADFEVPPGVEFFSVDMATGVQGGKFREAFLKGTRPPEVYVPTLETEEGEPPIELISLDNL
jgi:penicillin-binding protein 1A